MKGIIEAHGGTVEKFIGDAVMAVFGVPQAHEDDALRACRAAVEMRQALPELGLQARIGLNTGEVVTGTQERLATGDAVNVAARLEQAAQPGEILIGEVTLALVRDAVETEPVDPLKLKGKAEPVPALPTRHGARRARAPARDALRRQVRRARHLAEGLAARPRGATVRARDGGRGRGRRQVSAGGRVSRLGRGADRRRPLPALRRGDHLLAGRGGGEAAGRAPVRSGRSCLAPLPAGGDGRRNLGRGDRLGLPQAARRAGSPLVCVFDDIQWGEETFLDLVEDVALLSSQAPDPASVHGPPGAERASACMAGGAPARAALPRTTSTRCSPRRFAASCASRSPTRRAATRSSSPRWWPWPGGEGEVARPAHPARRCWPPASTNSNPRALRPRAWRGRRRDLPPRRGPGAGSDERQVTPRLAALVRKELIRPDRPSSRARTPSASATC